MKTNWEGLWYHGEGAKIYKSKAFSNKEIREMTHQDRKHTRILVRHNPYWKSDSNTPRYQFCFSDKTSTDALVKELEEEINFYDFKEDTIRIMRMTIEDLRSGDYSQAEKNILDYFEHWNM